jgi:hypothetical protein|tara:strand:+ start:85 stop:279 length:195 start_codon:yes stop_codon:yes gene_type:complete
MSDVRQATNRVLEMVEEGILDKDTVIMSCLKYMSEDDVADMAHSNEFFMTTNDEEDEDDEDDNS